MTEDDSKTQLDAFEQRLKQHRGQILEESDSSDEEFMEQNQPGYYSNENVRLQAKVQLLIQQLIDKDNQIESLSQALNLGKTEPEDDIGEFTTKKLMELAKKNRSLQVALESEKNNSARAMEEVIRLREQLSDIQVNRQQTQRKQQKKAPSVNLDDQLQQIRFKYHKVKADLNKAMRILNRELGEFESLDKVLQNENWKGRAQQIELQKSRIADLNRQLQQLQKQGSTQIPQQTLVNTGTASERRKEIEQLRESIQKAEEERDQWKKKAQGSNSRKVALEKEVKEVKEKAKSQIQTLIEKTETDDRLIGALREELERVRKSKNLPPSSFTTNNEVNNLRTEIAQQRQRIAELLKENQEKDGILELFKINKDDVEDDMAEILSLRKKVAELKAVIKSQKSQEPRQSSGREDAKLIKDLSAQNARYRSKINELTAELARNN